MYYSQFGQDKFVYEHYFQNRPKGYFIDVGAHDGVTYSNSKFFEDLGWQGICVEANPKIFELLKLNRKCKCINKALTDKTGKAQFFQITEGPDMLSGLVDDFSPISIKRVLNELGESNNFDYIEVECDILENIVDNFNINFLSLDTEGNEMKILQSIDFNKFNIEVITLENNLDNLSIEAKDYDNFINFLTSKGYSYITRLGCDEIYKKKLNTSNNYYL